MAWTLAHIPWDRFDPALVDPTQLALAKTASLVEYNSCEYGRYLCEVFAGDDGMCAAVAQWSREEVQHGAALRRWCERADPSFDFMSAFTAFSDRIRIPTGVAHSIRGSRTGELLARCVVECGTSLYYSSLQEHVREPVLRSICQHIAADEFRHYRLFLERSRECMASDPLSLRARLGVVLGRMLEGEDDELAFAWHCTNAPTRPYRRREALGAYLAASLGVLKTQHIERSIDMVLRAAGFAPTGRVSRMASSVALRVVRWRMRQVAAQQRVRTTRRATATTRRPRPHAGHPQSARIA